MALYMLFIEDVSQRRQALHYANQRASGRYGGSAGGQGVMFLFCRRLAMAMLVEIHQDV